MPCAVWFFGKREDKGGLFVPSVCRHGIEETLQYFFGKLVPTLLQMAIVTVEKKRFVLLHHVTKRLGRGKQRVVMEVNTSDHCCECWKHGVCFCLFVLYVDASFDVH